VSIRERWESLSKGKKVAGALTGIVAAGGAVYGGVRLLTGGPGAGPATEHPGHRPSHPGHDHHGSHPGAPGHTGPLVLSGPPPGGHPIRVLFHPTPRQLASTSDVAIRRDVARLMEDIRRSKSGEPPLGEVPKAGPIGVKRWDAWTYSAFTPDDDKHPLRHSVDDVLDQDVERMDEILIKELADHPELHLERSRFEQTQSPVTVVVRHGAPMTLQAATQEAGGQHSRSPS
jgi:hypothetical protein